MRSGGKPTRLRKLLQTPNGEKTASFIKMHLPILSTLSLILLPRIYALTVIPERHCGAIHILPSSVEKSQLDDNRPTIYELVRLDTERKKAEKLANERKKAEKLTATTKSVYDQAREDQALMPNTPVIKILEPMPIEPQPIAVTPNPAPVTPAVVTPPPTETQPIAVQPVTPVVSNPPPIVTQPVVVTPPTATPIAPRPTGPRCSVAAFVDASFINRHSDKVIPDFVGGMISDSSTQFESQFGFGFDLVDFFQDVPWGSVPGGGQEPIQGVNSQIASYNAAQGKEYCAMILFTAEVLGGV
jgi:hypothetical protein